ncbi:MAG: SH3 domain-containing protein, partial [bacterium]
MKRNNGSTSFHRVLAITLATLLLLAMVPSLPAGAVQRGYVSDLEANLRSGPGTDYMLLYTLPQGTEFLINDQLEDDQGQLWYAVFVPSVDLEGYIASWLVTLIDTPSTSQPSGVQGFVNSPANIRGGPGTSFERITSLDAGTPVVILGSAWTVDEELWYQVQMPDGEAGWIFNDLLAVAADLTRTPTDLVGSLVRLKADTPFRAGPGKEHRADSNLPGGAGGRVTGQAVDWRKDLWLQVQLLDQRSGWVMQEQAEKTDSWPLAIVKDVAWKLEEGVLLLIISGNGYLTGSPTLLANPDRIVLDLPYATATSSAALFSIKVGDVLRVRLRTLDNNRVRLFVDMKRPLSFYKAESL